MTAAFVLKRYFQAIDGIEDIGCIGCIRCIGNTEDTGDAKPSSSVTVWYSVIPVTSAAIVAMKNS